MKQQAQEQSSFDSVLRDNSCAQISAPPMSSDPILGMGTPTKQRFHDRQAFAVAHCPRGGSTCDAGGGETPVDRRLPKHVRLHQWSVTRSPQQHIKRARQLHHAFGWRDIPVTDNSNNYSIFRHLTTSVQGWRRCKPKNGTTA